LTACRVEPVSGPITIDVRREMLARTPEQEKAIERAWQALCAQNPRYFNGRILSFESFDASTNTAVARDVEYRPHAVRGTVDLGIAFFGVTGVLRSVERGVPRFLLGKRAPTVHQYGDQWEFAPCGGIDPPPAGQERLSPGQIFGELVREASEELGLDLSDATTRPLALVHDDPVGSTDLMLLVDLPAIPSTGTNWEYSATRWLTLDEIAGLHASPDETVIPTTLAMLPLLRDGPPEV